MVDDDEQDAPAGTSEIPVGGSAIRAVYEDGTRLLAAQGAADEKCRLLTIEGLDHRTTAYRETKQLVADIEADLGGAEHLSAMERQMVQHGAVLGAIANDMETKYLMARQIDLVVLCRVLNAQRRAFDAIGYKRRQRDVTPTLEGFLSKIEKS
jgi:hypothetical protein